MPLEVVLATCCGGGSAGLGGEDDSIVLHRVGDEEDPKLFTSVY